MIWHIETRIVRSKQRNTTTLVVNGDWFGSRNRVRMQCFAGGGEKCDSHFFAFSAFFFAFSGQVP